MRSTLTGQGGMVLLAMLAATGQAVAQPTSAAACSGCHAQTAEAPVPSLAGRPAQDIVAAMTDFRTGKREATVMDRIAKGFTDEETRAIADWYAAQEKPQP